MFGAGDPHARLVLVGEAPSRLDEAQRLPLAGRAGQLLDRLLGEIGLRRADVFTTSALLCRPPGGREALSQEIEHCREHLERQIELVAPHVVCPLGSFATRLLRGEPAGVRELHGRVETRVVGSLAVRLYPLFHPAAALYAPASIEALRTDMARLPALLELGPPPQPEPTPDPEPPSDPVQLGLF